MTPAQIIREEFERYLSDNGRLAHAIERNAATPDKYRLPTAQAAWEAWRAAWNVAMRYLK